MYVLQHGIIYLIHSSSVTVVGFEKKQQTQILYLNIPDEIRGLPVTEIGSCAFLNENICSVSIPKSIIKIKEGAFARCARLKHVILNSYVSFSNLPILEIGNAAFQYCSQLETVNLWKCTSTLGKYSFRGCEKLASLNLNIQDVDIDTFKHCNSLNQLFLSDNIYLEKDCFQTCQIKQLIFDGNAQISEFNKSCIKTNGIRIVCGINSNLAQLAYDGVAVEIMKQQNRHLNVSVFV